MATGAAISSAKQPELLEQILSVVQSIQQEYRHLSAAVESIDGRVNILAGVKQVRDAAQEQNIAPSGMARTALVNVVDLEDSTRAQATTQIAAPMRPSLESAHENAPIGDHSPPGRKVGASTTSRIILTTYPGQSGIDPMVMNWGHIDPLQRGPVVVSRSKSTIRRRNGMSSAAPDEQVA